VAEALLKAEGFRNVEYVKLPNPSPNMAVAAGNADISMDAVWGFIARIDQGQPVTVLAGVHLGCYQLIGSDRVRSIRDLKGKTVPVFELGDPSQVVRKDQARRIHVGSRCQSQRLQARSRKGLWVRSLFV